MSEEENYRDDEERRMGREMPLLRRDGELLYVGITKAKKLLQTPEYALALLPQQEFNELVIRNLINTGCRLREEVTGKMTKECDAEMLRKDLEATLLYQNNLAKERVDRYFKGEDVYGS